MLRLSFSQIKLYKSSPLDYFYKYVLKLPEKDQETKWLHFGLGVHEVLEEYYNTTNLNFRENAKIKFEKYNLKGRMNYDDFLKNIINGVSLQPSITDLEEEINVDIDSTTTFIGYLDVLDKQNHTILDWKTGTYTQQKENDYKAQLLCYAWMYYKKYNIIPTKCSLFFTKQAKLIDFKFTLEQINKFEMFVKNIAKEINYKKQYHTKAEQWGNTLGFFSGYHYLENLPTMKFIFEIKGYWCYLSGSVSPVLIEAIDKKLIVEDKNKKYMRFQYMKKYGNNSFIKNIGIKHLFDKKHKRFPLGLIDDVRDIIRDYALYKKSKFEIQIIDMRNKQVTNKKLNIMPKKLLSGKVLRPYQLQAVNSFIVNNGMGTIDAVTGAGKTLIASEIIRRLDTTTLFIINQKELMYQTKQVFESELGIEVGVIGDGNFDIRDITVATIQTLYRNVKKLEPKTLDYLVNVSFVIVDESHNTGCDSYEWVFRALKNAKYRLATTGTPFRDDGQDMRMWGLTGRPIYSITSKELIEQGYLEKPHIIFHKVEEIEKEKINYNLLSIKEIEKLKSSEYRRLYEKNIVYHTKRNNLIKSIVYEYKNHKTIIIVKSVEHGEILNELIDESIFIHGSLDKKTRKEYFDILKKSDKCCIIATIKIASEGLDVPDLSVLINASSNKGDIKSIQALGRILRKSKDKQEAVYIDFLDESKYVKQHSWKRYKTFKKLGYNVIIKNVE